MLFLITLSFVLSLCLTPLVGKLAVRLGWVDQPDFDRKIHHIPVPRVGGVAIVTAYATSLAALLLTDFRSNTALDQSLSVAWNLLPAVTLIAITGLLDDLIGLSPLEKLTGQCAAASLICLGGLHFQQLAGRDLGNVFGVVLTIVWLVSCANAFNLIDGVDGLATGLGLITAGTMLLTAVLGGDVELMLIAAPLVGSLLAFLRFNFSPASIFLGDSGSLSIGFLLGCLGIMWSQSAATFPGIAAPAVALSIPLLDTALSIGRRFVAGKPIFRPDHGHIHHCLMQRGFSSRAVCFSLYSATAVACSFAVVLGISSEPVGGIIFLVFCATLLVTVQCLRYQEFGLFASLLRSIRGNVQSQLSLHAYEERLRNAASPEECWSVLRKAGREFGFAEITLQLGGRHFEERASTNGHGSWNVCLLISASDYIILTRQCGSVKAAQSVARFADLLHGSLCEKAAAFSGVVASDQTIVIPECNVHKPGALARIA